MTIRVRYFASLRERVGCAEAQFNTGTVTTVATVWHALNPDLALPGNTLAAINHEYATLDAAVHDGDELAFFPPVTGG